MTSRYGRSPEFGVSIVPTSVDLGLARALTRLSDESGIEGLHPRRIQSASGSESDDRAGWGSLEGSPTAGCLRSSGPRPKSCLTCRSKWTLPPSKRAARRRRSGASTTSGARSQTSHARAARRTPEHWVDTLTEFASELGFDTFVFWPEHKSTRPGGAVRARDSSGPPPEQRSAVRRQQGPPRPGQASVRQLVTTWT